MKTRVFVLSSFLILSFLFLIGFNQASTTNKEQDKPSINFEKITEKAREAKIFCKKHKYNTDFCLLADMSLHSGIKRLFVWDFKKDTISNRYLVGHGCGDDYWSYDFSKENPVFSNTPDSHCSSLGKYKIGERGYSNWGIHVKYLLHGLEETNSNALSRQIVLHGWKLMSNNEIYPFGSPEGWGCPTVSNDAMKAIDEKLKDSDKPVLLWMFE